MRCIICLADKSRDEFSDEHVYPESIGGTLVIDRVCKPCNDRLGRTVDCHLVDHLLVQGERLLLHLPGKRGHIPNPLEKGTLGDDPDHKLVYVLDADGKPQQLYTVPAVNRVQNDDGTETVSIRVDKSDAAKLPGIVSKIRERAGHPPLSEEDFASTETAHSIPEPWMKVEAKLDLIHYQRAIMKIAYELAWYWLGDTYLDDPVGALIRRCMMDQHLSVEYAAQYPIRGKVGFIDNQPAYPFWNDGSKSHIAFLMSTDGKIAAYVRVFDVMEGQIVVSDNAASYPGFEGRFLSMNPTTGARVEVPLLEEFARLAGAGGP